MTRWAWVRLKFHAEVPRLLDGLLAMLPKKQAIPAVAVEAAAMIALLWQLIIQGV